MTPFWRHTWNVRTFFCMCGKRRRIDSYTVPWYQISIQAFIFQVHRGLQPPLVTKPSISHKVDMPILTVIFFTFNWLTLTSEKHFGKFYPEVASCLFSRGKRKYAPLGMRLLWKYINCFLVYHLISHFLLYLQNYKKFEAEILDLQSEKYGLSFDIKKYTTSGWTLGDENVIGIRAFNTIPLTIWFTVSVFIYLFIYLCIYLFIYYLLFIF